jgi:predicted transcriptional regulator
MLFGSETQSMTEHDAAERWVADRTTFQRVYDVLVGTHSFLTAEEFATRADCSETGARTALTQLVELGIATQRDGRPTGYRRNDAYFRWKRIESLAREHSPDQLRERIRALIDEDEAFQEQYGVPAPAAVSTDDVPVDDPEALEARWADRREWQTVRDDIRLLRRAVERAETGADDGVRA